LGAYSDDLLFIHIPKTGGTAVKEWLAENVPGMVPATDDDSPLPIGHIPLRDIQRFTGREPSSWKRIIAVVRNPYEQQLSQWMFWSDRYRRGQRHVHDITAAHYATLAGWLQDPRCDFHIWYESVFGGPKGSKYRLNMAHRDPFTRYEQFGGYYRYWVEVDGAIPQNVSILKQEDLAETLLPAVREFTIPDPPPLHRSNRGPRRAETIEYYTPHAARVIEAKFRWTFDRGYYDRWDLGHNDEMRGAV